VKKGFKNTDLAIEFACLMPDNNSHPLGFSDLLSFQFLVLTAFFAMALAE